MGKKRVWVPVSSQDDEELSPGLLKQGAVTRAFKQVKMRKSPWLTWVGETEAQGHLACLWQSYMSWFPGNICIVQRGNQPKKCGSEDKESSSRSFRSWLRWSQRHPTWRYHTCENWPVKDRFWLKRSDLIFGLFSSPCGVMNDHGCLA